MRNHSKHFSDQELWVFKREKNALLILWSRAFYSLTSRTGVWLILELCI